MNTGSYHIVGHTYMADPVTSVLFVVVFVAVLVIAAVSFSGLFGPRMTDDLDFNTPAPSSAELEYEE